MLRSGVKRWLSLGALVTPGKSRFPLFVNMACAMIGLAVGIHGLSAEGGDEAKTDQGGAEAIEHPLVNGERADIWVFAGQSNSQGWSLFKAPVNADPRVLYLFEPGWPAVGQPVPKDQHAHWVKAEEPINKMFSSWTPPPVELNILLQRTGVAAPEGFNVQDFLRAKNQDKVPLGGVGPGVFFANHLLSSIDTPIGLVYCGVGGSPIFTWDASRKAQGGGGNYFNMLKSIDRVGGHIKGIVYLQGETDAMAPGQWQDYEEALLRLIDAVREDTGKPDLPFIYGQIGCFVHPYGVMDNAWEKVRAAQQRVAGLRKNAYLVGTLDLPLEDCVHLSFEGYQRLGARLAEIALSKVYHQPGHGNPISPGKIELLQPENTRKLIRIHFDGVTGKLRALGRPTGFELRPRIPLQNPDHYHTRQKEWKAPIYVVYRVDFDPEDPAGLILGVFDNAQLLGKPHKLNEPVDLVYGPGTNPYVNIVDDKDIPIPGFGPLEVPLTPVPPKQ
ncbi:MAG: sialate O-acetylesterase [Planctomycetales bacterium]